MDLSIPGSTTNLTLSTSLTPIFGDNVQDLLVRSALNVNPTGIIVVNSIADTVDDPESGVTTLRDAINQANGDTGEDLIVFDRSLFSNAQTITLSFGELDLTHNLDIIAPRDSLTGGDLVTVSGKLASRVLEIESGATVSLNGLIVGDGLVINDDGGGIKNSGNLTLDSSIVNNDSARNGGGIYNDNGANLTVSNCTLDSNFASDGGGIFNFGGTVVVSNTTLSGNRLSQGSGAGIYNTGNLEVSNCTISNNSATTPRPGVTIINGIGGGIFNSGILTVSNSIISNNSAGSIGSLGIGIFNSGMLTVSNSTISGNKGYIGGGIYNGGISTVSNSTISSNSAIGGGGGIFNSDHLEVSNSTISGNSAEDGGGGIYNTDISTVSNSTISGNSGGSEGGGIFNSDHLEVSNSTISGNSAEERGGGIYSGQNNSLTVTLNNSTISGNSASQGGGIYNDYTSTLTLLFSTLTQNQADNAGGVYQNDVPPFSSAVPGSVNARNTIIAGNKLSINGVNPDVSGTFTSDSYNLIGDGTGSTGFDATGDIVGTSDNPIDPRLAPLDFYGGSTQTIALLPDSPAIGAGDPTVLDTDPTTDQRGLPRRAADGSADIGAFEFSS